MEQELSRAHRIGHDVGRRRLEWADVRVNEEHLFVAHVHISLGELRASGAHGFHFPALQGETGLEAVFDEVIEARLAVLGDQAFGCVSFGHKRSIFRCNCTCATIPRIREVTRSALVAQPPSRMFALINDIESYPAFVPGCTHSRVESRTPTEIVATLGVKKGPMQTEITTRNRLEQDRRVTMSL